VADDVAWGGVLSVVVDGGGVVGAAFFVAGTVAIVRRKIRDDWDGRLG